MTTLPLYKQMSQTTGIEVTPNFPRLLALRPAMVEEKDQKILR
jgi:hypothetical protein